MIKSIDDLKLSGRRVLVRVDFNVPLNEKLQITDTTRIDESLPTINKVIDEGGVAVLMSHLGRPKGKRSEKYSLKPVAEYLKKKVDCNVFLAGDCIGEKVDEVIQDANPGDIVVLENLRFHAEEEANDSKFSKELAKLGDVYVNDAFGTAHRAHASTEGVAKSFVGKRAVGYLIAKELEYLGAAISKPKKPLVAILGGSKVSDKIEVISNVLKIADKILIGGGMANTFLKAMGLSVGDSLVEDDKVELAQKLLAKSKGKIVLPTDAVVAEAFANDAKNKVVPVSKVANGWRILDIGQQTIDEYTSIIESAGTVIWNGPMGVFEFPSFAKGTFAIASSMASATSKGCVTIVGGGDSAAAISLAKLKDKVSHVSTGGGASLEFLEGKVLPGIAILEEK